MHEVIGLRPDTDWFLLCWTSELAKKHFSDLESFRGRIRANDIKGIQQPKQEARRAIRQRMPPVG
jgi:hypothetical protein